MIVPAIGHLAEFYCVEYRANPILIQSLTSLGNVTGQELLPACIVHSLLRKGEENETICLCYLCMCDVAGNLLCARADTSTCGDGPPCTPHRLSPADKYPTASYADGGRSQIQTSSSVVRVADLYQ